MAIEYDFREKPNPDGGNEKQPLYPRVVPKGTITSEELAKDIAQGTTFNEGEILGIMRALSDKMARYINDGYSVELKEIGYFTASLTARPVMDKKEIRAASVSVRGINFRISKRFKEKLTTKVVRSVMGFKKSHDLTPQQRKKILENYFKENVFIQRSVYTEITGLLKDRALQELNGWVKEGYLISQGRGSMKVFLPALPKERNENKEDKNPELQ